MFYHLCYEGNVDLDKIQDLNQRHALEVQIMEFGQIPKQVFTVPHPPRKIGLPLLTEPSQIKSSETEGFYFYFFCIGDFEQLILANNPLT